MENPIEASVQSKESAIAFAETSAGFSVRGTARFKIRPSVKLSCRSPVHFCMKITQQDTDRARAIALDYGMMFDSIAKQLRKQRIQFDAEKIKSFQKQLNAIWTLRLGGCQLPDSMHDRLILTLHKAVIAHVAEINKLKVIKNPK